jgi:large subunit ribosomal protein L23
MALLDFLKRKKQVEKSKGKPEKKSAKRAEKTSVENKEQSSRPDIAKPKRGSVFSYEAIKQPHISEKATFLSEKNQYVFEVLPDYNKKEIKNAVEGLYGVDVLSVNIIKIPSKKRRLGMTEGHRKSYIKAIVKIKEGQKIEIL